MEYQLLRFRVDHLCDLILSGQLALPDFQRDFVWGPSKVIDLLQSVAREWPVGSLLMLEGSGDFATKSIDCGPKVVSESVKYFLLDGQQRVTSIFHAVKDLSEYVYYIDFRKLKSESLDEDFIFFQRRSVFEKNFPDLVAAAKSHIAKISDVYEAEKFFEWATLLDEEDLMRDYLRIRRNFVYGLNAGVYSIPSTVLPSDVNFSALAKIFEGLNTNSVRLTTSDLLVAANLPKGVNLRDYWADFVERSGIVERLDLDLLDVLKVCALIEREKGNPRIKGLRQVDLIKVDPHLYRDNWGRACEQIMQAADYAASNLGVLNKTMLPTSSNLIALSFALQNRSDLRFVMDLWASWVFSETFAQSSHTRLLTELTEKRRSQWRDADAPSYLDGQVDLAFSKTCGSSGYLLRGLLSLRCTLAMRSDQAERNWMLEHKEKVVAFNAKTGLPYKKDDVIGDVLVGRRGPSNRLVPLGSYNAQAVNGIDLAFRLRSLLEGAE